ncbi:hypothetical protein [Alicyclobacillus sp. SO9]|uniref:hypothetical protein n=1 Tax=Alicyclobacillus sp. SO9 TaxID=2665646 RepID=UPI0018E80FD0|nr:hypothetical protein [Alicyclobacillus sp. SO9]QQE80922.1 hypothetical protein GI364_11355 [Alicyclobacillus sp. SO9]
MPEYVVVTWDEYQRLKQSSEVDPEDHLSKANVREKLTKVIDSLCAPHLLWRPDETALKTSLLHIYELLLGEPYRQHK